MLLTLSQDAFKQVYNWQYVHSVDFWALVLGQACDIRSREAVGTGESELHSLVYPLVQVTLGAIK
jgi:nucleolar complex protein 2